MKKIIHFLKDAVMNFEAIKKSKPYQFACKLWINWSMRADRKLGVDFSTWESNEEIGIDPSCGNQYQPSTDGLKKVLKKLPVTKDDTIIDIGCGKGKAMHIMSHFPFKTIKGIDLSERLCQIAKENFRLLHLEKCDVLQSDATKYCGYDDCNFFYIFNSFPEDVFSEVFRKLIASLKKYPRKIHLIYLNPVCHTIIEESGEFQLLFRQKGLLKWFQYNCYTNAI